LNESKINKIDETGRPIYLYYVYGIIIITVIIFILRIIINFGANWRFSELSDVDYRTLYDLMKGGLPEYYNQVTIAGYRAIYLYFWYFIFYPFSVIPLEIGVYIWDILRLITAIYIAKEIYKITEDKKDLIAFFILNGLGFFADAYLNNTNWLLGLLLFLSYIQFEKDRKLLAGILFAIAMYKINVIAFPILLLFVKKLKFKDLVYFLVPVALLCIPYIVFPNYLGQLLNNWTYVEHSEAAASSLLLRVYLISWQAFQTAQLMYMSIMVMTFLANVKNEVWKSRLRIIIVLFLIILNLSFPIILWNIPLK
jgi:hypothetical protein